MSDPDLDELAGELAEFDVPEKKGGRPRVRSESSPASRTSSAFAKHTDGSRSTARTATSSSGFTPCGWTSCANCLKR